MAKKKKTDYKSYLLLAVILLVTFLAYKPALKNGWTKWDDTAYILENPSVQNLSGENVKKMFSNYYMGNYTPLTFLSFAIEKSFFGESPKVFILMNILFHLINCLLIFFFVRMLLEDSIIALISAFLFAVHPLHVESVAWIAERKDVLYAFYFFLALISYVKYLKSEKVKWLLISALLMLFSVLSKSTAVVLPFILIVIDYFLGKKILSKKTILEKIPFLIITIIFVYIGTKAAQTNVADISSYDLSIFERIACAGFALVQYLSKLFVPTNLSAYYPYPFLSSETMPSSIWLFFALAVLFFGGLIYYFRANKLVLFSVLFFLISLFPALQFFPVGDALYADRFLYLPMLGFILPFAFLVKKISEKKERANLVLTSVIAVSLVFSYVTFHRTKIWNSPKTLWTDVVKKNNDISLAHVNLANAFFEENKADSAMAHYNLAIEKNPNNTEAFYNRAAVLLQTEKYQNAIADFKKVLAKNEKDAMSWVGMGLCYNGLNRFDSAVMSFDKSLLIDSSFGDVFVKRGLAYIMMNKYSSALNDFNKAIMLQPTNADAFGKRGAVKIQTGDTIGACTDFHKAQELGMQEAEQAIKEFCK